MSIENNKQDNNSVYFRFKFLNLEFELKGSEVFVEKFFSKIKDYIEEFDLFGLINYEEDMDYDEEKEAFSETIEEEGISNNKEDIIPLDQFLQQFSSDSPQKKVMAVGLYLIEILKKESFRSRDISNLLKKNKLKPITSISTHLTRLRNKNLLSVVSSQGKEANYTVYKDSLEKVKDFIKKK